VAERIRNVLELAKTVGEDELFAAELGEHLANRRLVHRLAALRAAKGLTQQDVAAKMGCSQAQVSRMEASEDFGLSFGSIVRFAEAIGARLEITLVSRKAAAVGQVKHHAFCIKALTDHLARLGLTDQKIAEGVARFFNETAFNLLSMLEDSARQLPRFAEEQPPLVVVDACGMDDTERAQESRCRAPRRGSVEKSGA
jgi:transcriptional regulator with XRE-family HTH domain